MNYIINYRSSVFLVLSLLILFIGTGLSQDLNQQKQQKLNQVGQIDTKLKSKITTDEYNTLIKEREKLVAEIKEIDKVIKADVDAMKRINAVKKAFNDGNTARKMGQNEQALEHYNNAISMDSTFYKAHYCKGLTLKKLRKYPEATAAYKAAILQNPSYIDAYVALGIIFDQRGLPDEAIKTYKSAIENDPTSAKSNYLLGAVYQNRKKNYKSAVESFTKATQINPEYELAFYSLGVSLTEISRFDEAIMALENALAVSKREKWADPHYRLASIYNKKGQFTQAKQTAMESLKLKPNWAPAAYEAGKACHKLSQFNEAIRFFEIVAKNRQWRRTAEYEIDAIKNRDKYGGNN